MWVQLLTTQHLVEKGRQVTYHPGDWVEVGRQAALAWVAAGQAKVVGEASKELFANCGILVREPAPARFGMAPVTLDRDPRSLLYPKNLLWDGRAKLPPPFLAIGFGLLNTWEAAVPLLSYEQLAASVGDEAERALTLAAVRDLRVLLYEPGVLFLRQCDAAVALLDRWAEERAQGRNRHLAFLRALYRTPLTVCALPTTWTGQKEPE